MSDHTPGPWKIKSNGNGLTPSIVTDDEFAATWEIARIKDVPAGAYKANASLIASAPDLLQALEHILKSAEWQGGVTYKIKDGDLEKARVAIAKAKGK